MPVYFSSTYDPKATVRMAQADGHLTSAAVLLRTLPATHASAVLRAHYDEWYAWRSTPCGEPSRAHAELYKRGAKQLHEEVKAAAAKHSESHFARTYAFSRTHLRNHTAHRSPTPRQRVRFDPTPHIIPHTPPTASYKTRNTTTTSYKTRNTPSASYKTRNTPSAWTRVLPVFVGTPSFASHFSPPVAPHHRHRYP